MISVINKCLTTKQSIEAHKWGLYHQLAHSKIKVHTWTGKLGNYEVRVMPKSNNIRVEMV